MTGNVKRIAWIVLALCIGIAVSFTARRVIRRVQHMQPPPGTPQQSPPQQSPPQQPVQP